MPHIVAGALKEYDWGVVDGLARWHGATGGPQAELWFGTHPAGEATVVSGPDAGRTLGELEEHRGMPLLKILAAARPLSIQVHPDAATAKRGWAAGSGLFADGEEKAEMLVALTPFEIRAGWRDREEAARILAEAGAEPGVVALLRDGKFVEAVRLLLSGAGPDRMDGAAQRAGLAQDEVSALARVAEAFPGDVGIAVAALLRHDVLQPGEAIAVPSGIVHSYVGGVGVEVMTSSDNVLRLGLTPKAIAVDEALGAVREDRAPQRLSAPFGETLDPAGMPFDLALVRGSHAVPEGRHRVVVAWAGDVRIATGPGAGDIVPEGRAAVWSPGEGTAVIEPDGMAIVATGDA